MNAMTQRSPAFAKAGVAQLAKPACAIRLIDRRTGAVHRVNGTPLVLFSRDPAAAAAELLSGRDPAVWEARIDAIEGGAAK